ncbi:MAG: ribosome-associated translation inhibitor RaiA [Rhodothermales bacterium]|nr:ribosome-associated translation inhibitor RaiA [Rhodothermales bacterium]
MDVRITARHFSLNPSQKIEVEQRVEKLAQYYDGISDVQVILDRVGDATDAKAAELNVKVFRQTLVSSAEGDSVETAVDTAIEKMRRQVQRYKAKLRSKDKNVMR